MHVFPAPLAGLAQRRRRGFVGRILPAVVVNLGQSAAKHFGGGDAILPLGGGIEIGDALFAIHGDDGVADLREHFAAEAVRFRVDPLQGENLRTGGTLHDQRINLAGTGVYASKKFFARPRPFVIDTRVQPCVKRPAEASYPSGHATDYFFRAGVLAEIFPERRVELFEFAWKAAWGRVLGGVHFPTDLVGGRLLAAAVVEELKKHPVFQSELKQSQAEVAKVVKR